MEITQSNVELLKAFARILRDKGIPQTTSEMICSMLKNKAQLDAMVDFIEKNLKATEEEVFKKATELVNKKK